ncbi:MAG: hypothetical protein ABEJ59_01935 [Halanaeroarchaeum sp.]
MSRERRARALAERLTFERLSGEQAIAFILVVWPILLALVLGVVYLVFLN